MTFDTNLQALTQSVLLPKVIDTVLNSNAFTFRILSNAQAWNGTTMDFAVQTSSAANGGSYSGVDLFTINTVDPNAKMQFDPRAYYQSITIPGLELDVNHSNTDRAADLMTLSMTQGANAMADGVGSVLQLDGTGNSNKNFLGLAAGIDDGGEVDSYGGLSRTTYTTIKANETDLGGALTLAAMATMYDSCKRGNDKPNLLLTTESIWSNYEALAQPTTVINTDGYKQMTASGKAQPALKGELGFDTLSYRGAMVVADEKVPSGVMWFINERWITFYALASSLPGYTKMTPSQKDVEGVYSDEYSGKGLGFYWTGWKQPVNQDAITGQILLKGNLIVSNPRTQGVLNTIS